MILVQALLPNAPIAEVVQSYFAKGYYKFTRVQLAVLVEFDGRRFGIFRSILKIVERVAHRIIQINHADIFEILSSSDTRIFYQIPARSLRTPSNFDTLSSLELSINLRPAHFSNLFSFLLLLLLHVFGNIRHICLRLILFDFWESSNRRFTMIFILISNYLLGIGERNEGPVFGKQANFFALRKLVLFLTLGTQEPPWVIFDATRP